MIAANIHLVDDLVAFVIILGIIQAGRMIRGVLGGLLTLFGFLVLIVSGIDSAIKLLSPTDWSLLERLYHLGWVIIGGVAAWIIGYGFRLAHDRMRDGS